MDSVPLSSTLPLIRQCPVDRKTSLDSGLSLDIRGNGPFSSGVATRTHTTDLGDISRVSLLGLFWASQHGALLDVRGRWNSSARIEHCADVWIMTI